MVWCETGTPDLDFARRFAEGNPQEVSGQDARLQLLAVVQLEAQSRRRDDRALPARARAMGYKFQFITLPASTRSTTACSSWRTGTRATT
jgi:isocitrate lyase